MDNKNNGLMTKIWGPPGWLFLHCVTMGYPYKIDKTNPEHLFRKDETKKFFESLGNVLPCVYCRKSYNTFLNNNPLTDKILDSRENIARWFYNIHNLVNTKLGVSQDEIPTFSKFYNQYEMFRAKCGQSKLGCTTPKDKVKKKSIIKIVDSEGKDYCINTTNDMDDRQIFKKFVSSNDINLLKLLSEETQKKIKLEAQICLETKSGNCKNAQLILDNL